MMLRSSDNNEPNPDDFHMAIGEDTPLRAQAPRLLTMTQAEFEERVAEAIRDRNQNSTSSSTSISQNIATPSRPRRGSNSEEAIPQRQTPASLPASAMTATAAMEAVLELKRLKIDLILTTTSDMEQVKANQISSISPGANKRFKALDNILHTLGLYSMASRTRREPIPTRLNPSGYSEQTTSRNDDGTYNFIPADDVIRWAHDLRRLFNIMLNAFHESTHYLCADEFLARDGPAIYKKMHEHFYGHTEADINRLRRLLQNFKGSTATYFKEDLVKFSTLIMEFEYAQNRRGTEQERLQFLHNAFINDPRPNVKAYFMTCHSNMLTYTQTMERSAKYFEHALPEKPVRIAALTTAPEPCRKFLAGTCFLGNKCKYYHAPSKATSATPPHGKAHPPAPPGSAPVTDKNRTKAKGKYPPKQTFPVTSIDGRTPYLKSNIPMKLLTNGPHINPDDGWQNNTLLDHADPPGFVRFSINMFHATGDEPDPTARTPPTPPPAVPEPPMQSPVRSPTAPPSVIASPNMLRPYVRAEYLPETPAPEGQDTPNIPVAPENASAWDTPRHQNISSPSYGTPMTAEVDAFTRHWRFLAVEDSNTSSVFQAVCRQCSSEILKYNTVVHHRIHQKPLSADDFIIYVHRPTKPGSPPSEPLVYLAIFGWVSPTTLSHCRADVRDGYSRYMNLVHKIGRILLLAEIAQPHPPNIEYDPGHYRTFNPTLIEDITTYRSTVTNIFFYFLVHTAMYLDENIPAAHMAIFESVLIYDCAAWIAAQLARYANTPGNSWRNISSLRVLMLAEVDANVDKLMTRDGSNESFIQAIRVVIQHVLPDPFHVRPQSLFVGPDPIVPVESHYRTVSLARDVAAAAVPQKSLPPDHLRNYESDTESSQEDSIVFLPFESTCPTHNVTSRRCAMSYVNYLHGAASRTAAPHSDNSPWVPPDASRELARYKANQKKRGIAFAEADQQENPKRAATSTSTSSSSSSSSASSSAPPPPPQFTTPLPPVQSTPSNMHQLPFDQWHASEPLASDSLFTFLRRRNRTPETLAAQRTTSARHAFNSTRPPLASGRPPAHSHETPNANLKTFVVRSQQERLNSFHVPDKVIFDSGASRSGTGRSQRLTSIEPVNTNVTVTPAFGPSMTPTHQGSLGPLELSTLLLPALGDSTLVSVSQFCAGGATNDHFIGFFTHKDFRFYETASVLPYIALVAQHGKEVTRGTVQDGLYVETPY